MIYCDKASNFVAGQKHLLEDVDWNELETKTARQGVVWRVNPSYSQWRTGRAERAVASLKKTMGHYHDSVNLSYPEKQLLLAKAVRCINRRPLGTRFKNGCTPDYAPITPLSLIFGPEVDPDEQDQLELNTIGSLVKRLRMIEEVHHQWWAKWNRDVFTGLLPLPIWKERAKNLQVGDICLLGYSAKYSPGTYRLCRVTQVFPDHLNLVRDVEVAVRPVNNQENVQDYIPRPLTLQKVSVQRLVLIHPREEQETVVTDAGGSPETKDCSYAEVWPLISENRRNVNALGAVTSDQSQTEPSSSLFAGSLLAGLGKGTAGDLDSALEVPLAGVDVAPEPHLRHTVRDTRLLDPNGNSSMCTGDLAVLDNIGLSDVDSTLSGLPAEPALDSADSVLLGEGEYDDLLLGHDLSGFDV